MIRHTCRFLVLVSGLVLGLYLAGAASAQGPADEEGSPLVATQWILVSMGPVDAQVPVPSGITVTLTLDPESRLYGSAGCNRYMTSYRVVEYGLSIGPIGSTRMMCPTDIMDLERGYLRALGAVSRYSLEGNTLWLYYEHGDSVLTLRAEAAEASRDTEARRHYVEIGLPTDGAVVGIEQPVVVRGTGKGLAGGTVTVRAEDDEGAQLLQRATTVQAPEGSDEGPWTVELKVNVEPGTHGRLVAYARSATDSRTVVSDTVAVTFGLAAATSDAPPPDGRVYIVQPGDWLSKIAYEQLGDGSAYQVIIDATNARAATDATFARITDQHVIEVGQKLWIPETQMEPSEPAPLQASAEPTPDAAAGPPETAPTPAAGAAPAPTPVHPLLSRLMNATYASFLTKSGLAPLRDGVYREVVAPGAATQVVVRLDLVAYGDLNGDGVEDAAVLLISEPGGSGSFRDLVAVISHQGEPVPVARAFLGDRVQVESLRIADGQVIAELVKHGPDDPLCCPSLKATQRFALELVPLGLG